MSFVFRVIFALMLACASLACALPAAATTRYVQCPKWTSLCNSNRGAPGDAITYGLNVCGGFNNSQLPIILTTCSYGTNDWTSVFCNGKTALNQTTGGSASGNGGYGGGNGIFTTTDPTDNFSKCAYNVIDDAKNYGPPPCPDCEGKKGNPVSIAIGNKYQQETDFRAGDEGGLEFTRTYNALGPVVDVGVGSNWTHTWSRSLFINAAWIDAQRSDGKVFHFTLSGGQWVSDADISFQLVHSGTQWLLTTDGDEIEVYDSAGKLISVTTRSGKVTTLSYTDGTGSGANGAMYTDVPTRPVVPGHLLRVTDFRGRTLSFAYSSLGEISTMTDPSGGIYTYTSGGAPQMLMWSVKYPDNATRTYIWNETANTSGTTLLFALTGITDENGARFATFKYLSDRRALSTEHAGGVEKYQFTYNSGSTSYVDPLGTTKSSPYSTILNVRQVTGTTQTCTGCGGTSTESYTFDANRNLASHKDFNGNLTCYTFGARNLESARTEGLSGAGTCSSRITTNATRTITTQWHATWRLPTARAEPLKITTYSYHGDPGVSCAPSGARTTLVCSKTVQATTDTDGSQGFSATADGAPRTWSFTYNLAGQVLTADGPRTDVTDVTAYSYYSSDDPSGNYKAGDLASITNALNQVTQFVQYDGAGRLLKSIDPNGLETILEYWPRGWLKTRKLGSVAAGYEISSFDYDNVGQLSKVTAPDASYVSYFYDNAHRLWKISDGLGNRIEYTLDNMGNRTAESAYDTTSTLVRAHTRVIDALNRVFKDIGGTTPATQIVQNGYDANGNLTSILDPLARTTTQTFDALNRLSSVIDPFNGSTHPTSYQYNRQSALTQVTDPSGLSTTYTVNGYGETTAQSSPDTGSTSFTFDAASNMLTKLDARGIQATYTYDALNRVTQIAYPDETVGFTYDSCANGVGRLCSITDRTGTMTYSLDLWGRVVSKSQTVGSVTQTMGYTFNSAGQLSTVTTPSGRSVVFSYSNNRPVSITVDGVNVLNSVFYEPFGPNGGWKWGNSTPSVPNTHTRVFDKDFRTTRVTSDLPASGTQPYFDKQVGWDIQSRVASITDLANSSLSATYGFDGLDRLTSVTQGSNSWGYSYNGTGDRLTSTVNAATTNYSYSAGTHRLSSLSGAQSKTYVLDAAGNTTADGTTVWTYAGNNRALTGGTASFLINALGQRVQKSSGSTTTRFVFDEAGRLWGEYDATGALIQETIWLDDLPVATLRGTSDIFYVHPDHLGTPRAVTRSTDNQFVWKWDNTEAFGNSAADENPSGLGAFAYNLRFPGQYFDTETGKHYNYYRDYDSSLGRYLQSDPIGIRAGLSTFAYVKGAPLSRFDRLGLDDQSGGGGGGGGGGSDGPRCFLIVEVPEGIFGPSLPVPRGGHQYIWWCVWICISTDTCPTRVEVRSEIIVTGLMGCPTRPPPKGARK